MNLFLLDRDPNVAAQYHCDKHVVKMVLETAQMLCTAHHVFGDILLLNRRLKRLDPPVELYKPTHRSHPCSKWVRESPDNYKWTAYLFSALCCEYTYRYGKVHASERLMPLLSITPELIYPRKATDPVLCMPEQYWHKDPVKAYRAYYVAEKSSFATWTKRNPPEWFPSINR